MNKFDELNGDIFKDEHKLVSVYPSPSNNYINFFNKEQTSIIQEALDIASQYNEIVNNFEAERKRRKTIADKK